MKKLLLSLVMILCFVGLAYADASFEIISQDIDDNGNIRVWTAHKIDGVEVESRYPKINDHYVWATRYSKQNFLECKDKAEIQQKILDDIAYHNEVLIQKEFDKKADKTLNEIRIDYNRTANEAFVTANLSDLVGKKATKTETITKIDTNNDGTLDKEIVLKSDGSKTEKTIEEVTADITL